MQDKFGQVTGTHSISAGLDYPSVGPEHAHLSSIKRAEYISANDDAALEAFVLLSQTEGILPAFESAHAIAAAVRIMQGSATVAMLTAGGLAAAMFGDLELTEAMLALYVIAIAAGATTASHVNDSGFWLVNRYLGLTVPETFKTWTALTTIASLVAIVLVMIVAVLI